MVRARCRNLGQTERPYGAAQLSPWLLFPIDGLNLKQGTCGELFGYGYLPLPLTTAKSTTAGKNVPTGDNCWTLFLNTRNFKGPVAFFTPYFWSHAAMADPRLSGMLLDSRPSQPNRALQMETQYIPSVQSIDARGRTTPESPQPRFPEGRGAIHWWSPPRHLLQQEALWDAVKAWFEGGPEASGAIDLQGAVLHSLSGRGGATWKIYLPAVPKEQKVPLAWNSFATPTVPNSNTFGYRWNYQNSCEKRFQGWPTGDTPRILPPGELTRTRERSGFRCEPKTFRLKLGLAQVRFNRPPRGSPRTLRHFPTMRTVAGRSRWPRGRTFPAHLGDGTTVTYYWYRFADQPALLNADLTDSERESLQARVEKLHRNWKKDRDYLVHHP